MLADERASTEHPRGREVRGGAPGEEGQCVYALACWLLLASRPFPRSSRAKSSHEDRARGLRGKIVRQCVVWRASWGWCGARGAARSGCVPAAVQEDGRGSEGSEDKMQ